MILREHRNILILGASGTIGIKILENFIKKEPDSYYFLFVKNAKELKKISIKFNFPKIKVFLLDLSKKIGKKYIKNIHNYKIDVFINASGDINRKQFLKESDMEWNRIINVNLNSPMKLIKNILPNMIKNKYGKIINFTSQVVVKTHSAASPSYEISKAGLLSLNRHLSKNFAKYNINFNTIMPGTIKSEMQKDISEQDFNKIKKGIPQKRLGTPEEVAELVFFLCSEKASYITGASINISGGSILD